MSKYSDEFKIKIVLEYLDGRLGFTNLAKKYDVKSKTQIRYWVNAYKNHGVEGLIKKETNAVYSVQFKLDVLSFMKRTGASYTKTALQFELTNPSVIASWKRRFLEGGEEALDQPRGRPAMSDKAKNGITSRKPAPQDPVTREQKLERENELLRLEVAYLKKLKAFQMDPVSYLEKHKQRYHSSSKKNSD